MISAAAPNFTLAEFERVSDVALSPAMREHARWHAERLQIARNAVNETWAAPDVGGSWQIHVTSFVRSRDAGRDHGAGGGVDWNVRDRAGNRNDMLTRWARDYLALNIPDDFAELIYEPGFAEEGNAFAHVHHTRRGFSPDDDPDAPTQILDEDSPGNFVAATLAAIPKPAQPIAIALGVAGVFFLADSILRNG